MEEWDRDCNCKKFPDGGKAAGLHVTLGNANVYIPLGSTFLDKSLRVELMLRSAPECLLCILNITLFLTFNLVRASLILSNIFSLILRWRN